MTGPSGRTCNIEYPHPSIPAPVCQQARRAGPSGIILPLFVGLLLALVLSACALNPVTGQSELMLVGEADEVAMGREAAAAVVKEYGVYPDQALQRYVSGVARPMAGASHRPALPWQFQVMDSPVVNAFAAPGGYVFVTRGLLAAVNDEAELAGVLAHEIGHVTARHSARSYSKSMLAGIGVQLGTVLAGSYGSAVGQLLETGTGLLFLKYSRDDERQADALGVEYAYKAGYDTNRMADFFTTLQRQEQLSGQRADGIPEWFSTHPGTADREATVRSLTGQWRSRIPQSVPRIGRDDYLARIDGMIYGDDPRQGFRTGDWYCLPQYQAEFKVPSRWELTREGERLRLIAPDRKGLVIIDVAPGRAIDAARGFASAGQASVEQTRQVSVNGSSAVAMISTVADGAQRLKVASHFIQRGERVFTFHGISAEGDYPRLSGLLSAPAESLAPITDPGRLNPRPRRVAVRQVHRAATVEEALRDLGAKREDWPQLTWLNGLRGGERVAAGQRLKIIQ